MRVARQFLDLFGTQMVQFAALSNGQPSRRKNHSGQEFDFASYPFLYSHQIVWNVFDDNAPGRRQPDLKQVEEEMIDIREAGRVLWMRCA